MENTVQSFGKAGESHELITKVDLERETGKEKRFDLPGWSLGVGGASGDAQTVRLAGDRGGVPVQEGEEPKNVDCLTTLVV